MNNFVVSARKYRPVTFDTVVGQSSITGTLKNAIKNNHLAQAFLFCGPRGVGKTTCARILAKTINCENISSNTEACNQCESCQSFNNSSSLNIFELDAASNNSVDDIRNLVDQVRYAPASGKFKIYIIDEVHMLSAGAFNAFLKTLEEPPSYAIFILATTEKHKIIPTIISRCQIFDFNRIGIEDIAKHLQEIAKKENVNAEPDALHIIAQKADGALRDALSIFDQIVSFAGDTVTYKDVINNLNVLDYDYYFKITDSIISGNISNVLLTFDELLNEGFDGHQFINGLSSHFRDLLVCRDEQTLKLLEVTQKIKEQYFVQSKKIDIPALLQLLDIANKCDIEYKTAKNQRLHVELTLLKMCKAASGKLNIAEKKTPDQRVAATQPAAPIKTEEQKVSVVNEPAPAIKSENRESKNENRPAQQDFATLKKPDVPNPKPQTSNVKPVRTPSISIKKQNPVEQTEQKSAVIESLPENNFTEEQFIVAWNEYATKIKQAGKFQLHSTMTHYTPQLSENFIVDFKIENRVQEDELKNERNHLLTFLRTKLQNGKIDLRTQLKEPSQTIEVAYTQKEQFEKMAQKNPSLHDLTKQLGLEID